MSDTLGLDELARRLGETPARLREWRSLGLLGRSDIETIEPQAVERARLIQLALRRGIDIATIARADREHAFLERYVGRSAAAGAIYSLAEAATRTGLASDTLQRLAEAGRLPRDDLLYDEDLEALLALKIALEVGFPDDALRS